MTALETLVVVLQRSAPSDGSPSSLTSSQRPTVTALPFAIEPGMAAAPKEVCTSVIVSEPPSAAKRLPHQMSPPADRPMLFVAVPRSYWYPSGSSVMEMSRAPVPPLAPSHVPTCRR